MATLISKYSAIDGTEFSTEHEADAHTKSIVSGNSVEAYIRAANQTKAQAGLLRKHVPAYLAFIESDAAEALINAIATEKAQAEASAAATKAVRRADRAAAKRDAAEAAVA